MKDEKEKLITNLPQRYLIFIDETGDPKIHFNLGKYNDPSVFPVMTVTAVVLAKTVYQEVLMPGLDEIKDLFFGSRDVYFHSREIRRKDGIFKIFLDDELYRDFKERMALLLEKSSITIISSSINKIDFAKKAKSFKQKTGELYNIGSIYLRNVDYVLERVGHFLKNETGKIVFEMRGKKESKRIQAVLNSARQYGTFYCDKTRFEGIDKDILFFSKEDNITGLQVVDYCTYPFARHAKDTFDQNNKFFQILKKYIYKGDYGVYGLKEWP
jgi:hypothetical protein